jgi:hypothetical protein
MSATLSPFGGAQILLAHEEQRVLTKHAEPLVIQQYHKIGTPWPLHDQGMPS